MLLWLFLGLPSGRLYRLTGALVCQTLAAWPMFVLLPIASIPTPEIELPLLFQVADWVNLDNNYLPSLHVSYATTCAFFAGGPLWTLWAVAISASTLLCHQHYLLDVLAGFLLGWFFSKIWSTDRPLIWCLKELIRCSARHPRYALISLALIGYATLFPKRGYRALLGFCYLQHIDDLLDGHLASAQESEDIALAQLRGWEDDDFPDETLSFIAFSLREQGVPKEKLVSLIKEMLIDRARVRDRVVLEERDLLRHLHRTFELSFDLMLWAADSQYTSAHSPSLVPLLGWCSLYRDFSDDLQLGLVNLPHGYTEPQLAFQWLSEQTEIARENYLLAEQEIKKLDRGSLLFRIFHRSVKKYLRRANRHRLLALSMQVARP